MKIAIVGYGTMGREIAGLAKERGIEYVTVDPDGGDFDEITPEALGDADVATDFTHPEAVMENLRKYAEMGTNVVMGTTGWYDDMERVKNTVAGSDMGLIWSGNFSLGVNLFFRMVDFAARTVDNAAGYDVFLHEFHHNGKVDSPSGTAEMLGGILLENIRRKDELVFERLSRRIGKREIHVSSTRAGSIPGTHVVGFDSDADTIELKHTARNRRGFAEGALLAADFIIGRKGLYGIDDLMDHILEGE